MTIALINLARRLLGRASPRARKGTRASVELGEATSFIRVGDIPFRLDGDYLVSKPLEVVDGAMLTVHIERMSDRVIPAPAGAAEADRDRLVRLAQSVRILLSVA